MCTINVPTTNETPQEAPCHQLDQTEVSFMEGMSMKVLMQIARGTRTKPRNDFTGGHTQVTIHNTARTNTCTQASQME
jgi:hypothetical protein